MAEPPQERERAGQDKGGIMNLVRLYMRVLGALHREKRLAWILAIANLALAGAQFAQPVLFGRVVDTLTGVVSNPSADAWPHLVTLMILWGGFAAFTILCSTLVALYADRLAHQQRHCMLSDYFEHVLQLPLAFHGERHSGRLMKIMLQGTDSLWGLWVGFFRDHFAGFVSFFVLLPLSVFMNWRLALLLIALCAIFAVLTVFVMRKTEELQGRVETHYSELAERASDTLGNVQLVHSFARI